MPSKKSVAVYVIVAVLGVGVGFLLSPAPPDTGQQQTVDIATEETPNGTYIYMQPGEGTTLGPGTEVTVTLSQAGSSKTLTYHTLVNRTISPGEKIYLNGDITDSGLNDLHLLSTRPPASDAFKEDELSRQLEIVVSVDTAQGNVFTLG